MGKVARKKLAVPLKNILSPHRIVFTDECKRLDVLHRLADKICTSPAIKNSHEFKNEIIRRENFFFTTVGFGIAIPHVRLQSVTDFVLAAGVCSHPIMDTKTPDDIPIRLVFMMASPHNRHVAYLQTLSELCIKLREDDFRNRLFSATSPDDFFQILTG